MDVFKRRAKNINLPSRNLLLYFFFSTNFFLATLFLFLIISTILILHFQFDIFTCSMRWDAIASHPDGPILFLKKWKNHNHQMVLIRIPYLQQFSSTLIYGKTFSTSSNISKISRYT